MDKSQMTDMQEMVHIISIFKSLYLRSPSQLEVSAILKGRKLARIPQKESTNNQLTLIK
jgi:hypothetical protein